MVDITVRVPDSLAERLVPMQTWLPFVLELSFVGFKTPAVQTASEIIDFLSTAPSPAEVLEYHASKRAQERLRKLLALNSGGVISSDEQLELDELERMEHIVIMLKSHARELLN